MVDRRDVGLLDSLFDSLVKEKRHFEAEEDGGRRGAAAEARATTRVGWIIATCDRRGRPVAKSAKTRFGGCALEARNDARRGRS
jgi:hypothetical protein